MQKHTLRGLVVTALLLLLSACSGLSVEQVVSTDEPLVIERYFAGNTRAHGILFDRSGKATRHFKVNLHGTWDESKQLLVLDEDFTFNDGEQSQRQWRITRLADGSYSGEADDVNGKAVGSQKGNTLLWRYELNVPYKGDTIAIKFEDWMFLSDDVLINRAVMRKFGFKVGEVLLSFDRKAES